MNRYTVNDWFAKLGPGLMLAAAAVGVSHLVQSTKAGADFGLSFSWLIVLIAIIKYPAFRFAVDYASHTEHSLVQGYKNLGGFARAWLLLSFSMDMFVATTAVSLVTAGLLISAFSLPFTEPQVTLAVLFLSALILLNGNYVKAERLVKVLVLLFSLLTLISTLIVLPKLGSNGRDLFGGISLDKSVIMFVIAVAGWMPLPMSGSIFLSSWAKEKKLASPNGVEHKAAIQDLRFGWILTIALALCFLALGTAVLFQTEREAPASAAAMAAELFRVFTSVIGGWAYPVIVAAAIAVMWSSVLAILDAIPRVASSLFDSSNRTLFLLIQVLGTTLVVLFLMDNFRVFINFATGAAFVTAPIIAYYNYRAVISNEVAQHYRPSNWLLRWHWVSLVVLILFSLTFFIGNSI